MWNEHFGIGVVELMAAGILTIAHNSGGPKADIVVPLHGEGQTGFLASTVEEYAERMDQAMRMSAKEALEMRKRAREASKRFSDEVFNTSFKATVLQSGLMGR
uniref:Glycosyl transferase family 1 domain-containing protein n=1 Tax=Grammatophora oceanica TaxID=210454 RepID=A0A7S1UU61_9STRA|mmetsp:Transcript_23254/g.34454  ORF Transcript_23254/g.34454 Transcript_23254/m.34454 type:complete len:103 (+) Transcript_23254:123-431(+)